MDISAPVTDPAGIVMPALVRTLTGSRDEAWSELHLTLEELNNAVKRFDLITLTLDQFFKALDLIIAIEEIVPCRV